MGVRRIMDRGILRDGLWIVMQPPTGIGIPEDERASTYVLHSVVLYRCTTNRFIRWSWRGVGNRDSWDRASEHPLMTVCPECLLNVPLAERLARCD